MKKKYYFIVVIVFQIPILLMLFLMTVFPPSNGVAYTLESVRYQACQTLVNTGCKSSTGSIALKYWDANKDEKMDSSDTLFALCQNYYNITSETNCKELCGC